MKFIVSINTLAFRLYLSPVQKFSTLNGKLFSTVVSNTCALHGLQLDLINWRGHLAGSNTRNFSAAKSRSSGCAGERKKMGASTKDCLLMKLTDPVHTPHNRITIVGTGAVGMAIAFGILNQKITSDLVLCDVDKDRMKGELMDLQHGSLFLKSPHIKAAECYEETEGSKLCIVTAGARQKEGESRLSLVQRNVDIFKSIIPSLVQHSPDCILLIVSNPVDLLTYIAWKLSGLPQHRVIGSGTNLDTSRFRFLLGERLGISPTSVHAYIIGEHGDSSVPVWSSANVGGVKLRDVNPNIGTDNDTENFKELHKEVIDSAYNVIKAKGFTNWAVGLSVCDLASTILRNIHGVRCVSVCVKGCHGVEQEVYLSLPAVISAAGVESVLNLSLSGTEKCSFRYSAGLMFEIQDKGVYGIEEEVYLSLPTTLGGNGAESLISLHLDRTEMEKFFNCVKLMVDVQKMIKL